MRARVLFSIFLLISLLPGALFAQVYGVSVTPQGDITANRTAHSTGFTQVFRVQHEGSGTEVFTLTCGGGSGVACTGLSQSTATLTGAVHVNVTATYSTASQGTGQLYFRATSSQSTDQGFVWVPIVPPAGAPRMTVLFLDAKQDLGRCAVSCFAASYAQSTVPYIALDAPRNVTLVYHGDRVGSKPFVAVDVIPDTTFGTWPSEYQMQVKVNGSLVTFVNGEQTLRFAGTSGSTPYRLAAQFDASSYTHGTVYSMEILVAAKISGTLYTNRWITQYPHIEEAKNPIARGWTVAGIQRLFAQSDTSALITEGDGSATFFKWDTASHKLIAPVGDFSTLTVSGATWIRAFADSTKLTFNSAGLLVKIADRWGNRDSVLYSGSKISSIKDPLDNSISFSYGTYGLSAITDPMSRATTITVQSDSTLTAIQDPDGVSTALGYDGSRRLLTITNRNGKTTTLAYDGNSGKLSTITAPSIPVYGGGSSSPVTSLSAWQAQGVPYAATNVTAFTPPKSDTTYARVTEPGGSVTKFTVNRWGTPAVTTDAVGRQVTVTYTDNGQPAKITHPDFTAADTLAYNSSGLVTYRSAAGSTATIVLYGGWGQPTDVYGSGQDSTHYFLGSNGRVDSVRVAGGPTNQRYTYDAFGRIATVRETGGTTIATNAYSSTATHKNLSSITSPGGRVTSFGYDSYGRQTTISPPMVPTQTTYYSTINRVDSVKVATSTPTLTKYVYDSLYLKKVTDPKAQDYQYVYNALGWVIKQIDPAGGKDSLQYDPNGDLRRRTNRRGQNIDFSYDGVHRLTSQAGSNSISWSYPSDSLTIGTSSAAADSVWSNVLGSPTKATTWINSQGYTRTYLYTGFGLLDSVNVTGPGGTSFKARKYVYDTGKGILTDIRLGGSATSFTADGNFNLTYLTHPGGALLGRLPGSLGASVKDTTETVNNLFLERWIGIDSLGRIDRHLRQTAKQGRWFSYDSLGQLRKGRNMGRNLDASLPGGCPTADYGMSGSCTPLSDYYGIDSTSYTYDAVGNRTDNSGAYTTGNRITTFGNCTYTTDADGNVTAKSGGSCSGAASFFWTAEGQLDSVQVTGSGTGIKYRYDALGRLVQKRVNGSSSSYFIWDGDNLLAELNGAASSVSAEYSYYPGLDDLHALVVGGTKYYARNDGLGNVLALTDTAKVVKSTYEYDDWGHILVYGDSASFSGVDRARWKGALWMGSELEIYYMRNRWYEPTTGRFLSEDPRGLAADINPSIFGGNDPVNGADPTGLCTVYGYHVYVWNGKKWIWIYDEITGVACGSGELVKNPLGPPPSGGGGSNVKRVGRTDRVPFAEEKRTPNRCFAENNAWLGKDFSEALGILGSGAAGGLIAGGAVARTQAGQIVRQTFGNGYASDFTTQNGIAVVTGAVRLLRAGSWLLRIGVAAAGIPVYFATSRAICQIAPNYGSH